MEKAREEAKDLDSCPNTQQLWDCGQISSGLEDFWFRLKS